MVKMVSDEVRLFQRGRMCAVPGFLVLLASLLCPVQLAAQNLLNIPDPRTAAATDLANRLNSLTPQAVPQETIALGALEFSPDGSKRMIWAGFSTSQTPPTCPQYYGATGQPTGGATGLVLTSVLAPVVQINSFNEQYQILIDSRVAALGIQVALTVPTLNGSENYTATLTTNPPGSGWFAGATVATIAFHPRTFRPQTLQFISAKGEGLACYTIIPKLQPQLGAFVVPYLPVAIVYQPPAGCGQCVDHTPNGDVIRACGSTASYEQGTKIGTTFSWGTSSTSGTINEVNSNDFFKYLSQAAGAASTVAGVIPGGQAAAGAFDTMGKVADFLGGLSNTQISTTLTITKSQTQARGWVIAASEGYVTDVCQKEDLFVYLQDVVFVYAVVPIDPVSRNVTPDGVPTVILAPYYYKATQQRYFSHLPAAVVAQFRALDVQMNLKTDKLGTSHTDLPGFGFKSRPRLIPRPGEECPVDGHRTVTVEQDQLTSSETSQATTVTTTTNVTGLLASIFQIDPESHTITSGGQAGETTQSMTYSSAVTNWNSVSQKAGLDLKCPEVAPAPGREMSISVDSLFDTLVAVPGPVEPSGQAPIPGTISSQPGYPVANREVLLRIGGKSYRVFSDANGRFAFRFASIPKGRGVVVVGKDTFPVSYNGTPLTNLSLRLSKGLATGIIGQPTTAPVAPGGPLKIPAPAGGGPAMPSKSGATVLCCEITAINLRSGLAFAKVKTSGQLFEFAVKDPALLKSLRIGQGVFADFRTRQVSLDGRTTCCSIVAPPGLGPSR